MLLCIAMCTVQDRAKEGCRLWPYGHVFYREPGWSSPMYTLHNAHHSDAEVLVEVAGGRGWGVGGGVPQ